MIALFFYDIPLICLIFLFLLGREGGGGYVRRKGNMVRKGREGYVKWFVDGNLLVATAKEAALGGLRRDGDGDGLAGSKVSLAVVAVSKSCLLDESRAI